MESVHGVDVSWMTHSSHNSQKSGKLESRDQIESPLMLLNTVCYALLRVQILMSVPRAFLPPTSSFPSADREDFDST
jgi:hypothetical protein